MIRRIIFFALVLAFGYTFSTDVPSCNPFAKYQDTDLYSTCKDSKLEYGAFGSPLKVVASLGNCGMNNGTSEITAFFADKRIKLQPAESYYFEYSINTTSKYGSCIVAIHTSDGEERIKDQNGIENSAEADTTEFSLDKWYERKFIIKNTQLPRDGSVRLSLSCASAEASRVEVHIDNIRLGRVGINKPDYVLFDSKTMCPACKGSAPVPTANCEPNGQNSDPIWTVEGHVRQQNITMGSVTIFKGDVYTDKLDVSEVTTIRLSGCLYPLEQKTIELVVSPTAMFVMFFHGENCLTPTFSIVPKYERDERCEYKIRPLTIRVVEGSVFYSIHYVFDAKCQSPELSTKSNNADQNGTNQVLALVILMVTIGVGATLGVSIYVVRRHKQKKVVTKFQQIRLDSQEDITL